MATPKGQKQKKKFSFLHKVIAGCFVGLAIGCSVIATIVITHYSDKKPEIVEIKTPQQIEAEKIAKAKLAENTATWETYHCNLMHRYYKGSEIEIPMGELLGLNSKASEDDIEDRCAELLPTVRLMGGLPSSRPQQDNYVVCEGFELLLPGAGNLTIRPTIFDLKYKTVRYGPKDNPTSYEQEMLPGQSVRIGEYFPVVAQAGDRCVVVSIRRLRGGGLAAKILRTISPPTTSPPTTKSFLKT